MDSLYASKEAPDWKTTTLWRELEDKERPEADLVRTTLKRCMPDIQKILAQGGTSPADFTLHDAGHAYRVAEYMTRSVIPSDVLPKLSAYELALLLLSAYLHDIGMTPERRKVTLHDEYLITGEIQDLSETEVQEFQKWLDIEGGGVVPPLMRGTPRPETLQLATELITYYCRERHVDWSEEWINKNLRSLERDLYTGWVDDLIVLCRSHRQNRSELLGKSLNPRIVDPLPLIVHIRYLAAVLRLADTLDIDPERTPEVILRHRNIASRSVTYWQKDAEISLLKEGNRLAIHASPPNARLHRAVEETADQIEYELRLCQSLGEEIPFVFCPGLSSPLPHRWELSPYVTKRITPRNDSYVYINGAFRPDTKRLLEILSGVELYGNPLAAIRELLENAFDAVRERIAYQRLAQNDPNDPGLVQNITALHHVELRLEVSSDGAWLICTDTGVGMTQGIIANYLLVSGRAKRHDILELERRCQEAGFSVGRTGQFGIGVLSYFMVANLVRLTTRRAPEPVDAEQTGWRFETEGIGAFGELRQDTAYPSGSQVCLRLRPDAVGGSPADWYSGLRMYLKDNLVHAPCRFEFKSELLGCEPLTLSPGWALNSDGLLDIILKDFRPRRGEQVDTPIDLLPYSRRQELEAAERQWQESRHEAKQCLRWMVTEGELSERLGRYRIHLPYFDLPDGASLGFLRIQKDGNKLVLMQIAKGYLFFPRGRTITAWKGFVAHLVDRFGLSLLRPQELPYENAIVEVDWYSAEVGEIQVNRNRLVLSEKGRLAVRELSQKINQMRQTFLHKNEASVYATLNHRLAKQKITLGKKLNWLFFKRDQAATNSEWRQLKFPLINSIAFIYSQEISGLEWKGRAVSVIPSLSRVEEGSDGYTWNSPDVMPNRIVVFPHYMLGITPMWVRRPQQKVTKHTLRVTCQFPPKWPTLCGVYLGSYQETREGMYIWNPRHLIVRVIDEVGWSWCREIIGPSLDPLPHRADLLASKSRAASWIVLCLQNSAKELWDGLQERDASFLQDVWELLFRHPSRSSRDLQIPICQWMEDVPNSRLRILTPKGWNTIRALNADVELARHLPDPGLEWQLVSTEKSGYRTFYEWRNIKEELRTHSPRATK